jgi:hypothetical protein
MNRVFLLGLVALAACATTPQSEGFDDNRVVFKGFTVDEVREVARAVVEDITHPKSCRPGKRTCRPPVVRVHDDRVVTDGRIGVCGKHVACGESGYSPYFRTGTPWTTIKVELEDLGMDTAVEVDIEFETVPPNTVSGTACTDTGRLFEADCVPEVLGSNGVLEQEIIAGIRAGLDAKPHDDRVSLRHND